MYNYIKLKMSAYIQTNQTIQLPDSYYTVSSVDTGKKFLISAVTALRIVTLPTPSVINTGLHYVFINRAPILGGAGNNVRILGGGAGLMRGTFIAAATIGAITGQDGLNFIGNTSARGDKYEVYCDGIECSTFGNSSIVGGITAN